MKRKISGILTVLMAATLLTGCGNLKDEDTIVTVGEHTVTAGVANFYTRFNQAEYETYYSAYLGDDFWGNEAAEGMTYEESVKETALEQLEEMAILQDHMADFGVEITAEDEAAITTAAEAFVEKNDEETIETVSGSKENIEEVLKLMTIQTRMREAVGAEVDTEVADEEAAQKQMDYVSFLYKEQDESGTQVDITDEAKKAEIKKTAEDFAAGAASAADFKTYATEQGQEPVSTTFDKDSTSLTAQFLEAADQLAEGATSGVIETDNGCYVAKVNTYLDRDATDAKKEQIVTERKNDHYTETVQKWLDGAEIKVNKGNWKKISLDKVSVKMYQEATEDTAE